MQIQLTDREEHVLSLAKERQKKPLPRLTAAGDCVSGLWDSVFCMAYHEELTMLAYMNLLDVSWIPDGLSSKLPQYRINNAGHFALWLNQRNKEKEAV